jgi:hypothetical protein
MDDDVPQNPVAPWRMRFIEHARLAAALAFDAQGLACLPGRLGAT